MDLNKGRETLAGGIDGTILDRLLQSDSTKINNLPKGEIEIPRLSEAVGVPFILQLQAVPTHKVKDIQEMNTRQVKVGKDKRGVMQYRQETDAYKTMLNLIVAACVDPDFKDSRLREKFKTEDPTRIVEELFLIGEINDIADKVNELCGMNDDDVSQDEVDKEIKN